ncbi:MAG TPA: prepilin-type N-terminal cleavage/methylation domain-containing protein [Fimbriiglobus sp.]
MTARIRNRGFTLVELLVVIAILAVLASLIVAGVMKTRTVQQVKTSEDTVRKLESSFVLQVTAVLDSARKDSVPAQVLRLAENDPERAKSLWAYIKYRRAFPETFAEAKSPLSVWDPAVNGFVILPQLSAPNIYTSLPAVTTANADIQAAACAFLFMTKRAERGEVAAMEEGMGSQFLEVDLGGGIKGKVFKDTFNNPITFRRFVRQADLPPALQSVYNLDLPPYVKAGLTVNHDPFDPVGRLRTFALATNAARAYESANGKAGNFANLNVTGTFWSAGLNGKFGDEDDILGFHVQQGN